MQMKPLTANGVERTFPPDDMPATVADLVNQLDVKGAVAVAEINGTIVRPEEFARTELTDGQSIELVRFVGGG
jgi:sulfur carrier protein